MPLFDYVCPDCGESTEELVHQPFPESYPCSCGGKRRRCMGLPAFQLSWARPPMDTAKDIWEGFPGL
jgi:putative FmdB family regulatory protein